MLTSSRNTLTDTPRNNILAVIWTSVCLVKLTHKTKHHSHLIDQHMDKSNICASFSYHRLWLQICFLGNPRKIKGEYLPLYTTKTLNMNASIAVVLSSILKLAVASQAVSSRGNWLQTLDWSLEDGSRRAGRGWCAKQCLKEEELQSPLKREAGEDKLLYKSLQGNSLSKGRTANILTGGLTWSVSMTSLTLSCNTLLQPHPSLQFSSVHFSLSVVSDSLQPHESQHTRPPCPSPAPGVHSDSHPSSPWCHPAISSWVVPFSSYPQSLPASESFPMSQLFAWGGQSIRVSALASVLPVNTQDWSPLGWTGWISL